MWDTPQNVMADEVSPRFGGGSGFETGKCGEDASEGLRERTERFFERKRRGKKVT